MLTQVSLLGSVDSPTWKTVDVDPDDSIILKSVSGLTPSDVTLFTGDFAGNGGYYQGRRVGGRNVVFNFKLNPDYSAASPKSIGSLRRKLYSWFYQPVQIGVSTSIVANFTDDELGGVVAHLYADKYQGDLFSQSTDVQISTQSVDAYLTGAQVVYNAPGGGVISVPLTYEGSSDTGFDSLVLVANVAGTQWTVDYYGRKIHFVGPYAANDTFSIGTQEGNVFVNHFVPPSLFPTSGIGNLTADSEWIQLVSGTNTLKVYGDASGDGKVAITSYRYTKRYWGL